MTLTEEVVIATPIITALLSIGGLFWRVLTLEKRIDKMSDQGERLVRLETKIDLLLTNKI